ncbi:MAG: biotin/lipoate A/B protein ligase family protein [Nitrospinaceae bacterium]
MKARLMDMGSVSPLRSQSLYHALTASMDAGSDVVITLMRPKARYVSIGFFQEAGVEVDLEFCRRNKLEVIRRQVGGGAVLLDGGQLFFHVILPSARAGELGLPPRLGDRFAHLAAPPIDAYRKLGIQAEFRPVNDIHVQGRKIGGTGMGEIGEGLVFAGSMMLDFDTATMARVLKVPEEKMRDKIAETLDAYMTTMKRELGEKPALATVAEHLVDAFEERYGLELIPSLPTPEELDEVYRWDGILSNEEWLNQVALAPRAARDVKISADVHLLHAQHKASGGMIRATARVVDERIGEILFSGDFPVTPKSALAELAGEFSGAETDLDDLQRRVEKAFQAGTFEMAGVEPADFVALFQQLVQ